MDTLSTKCIQTETDATTLSTEVTELGTTLATIKSMIADNADDLSTLKAKNASQDSQLVAVDTDITMLETAMLELEAESTALLAYVDTLINKFSMMTSELNGVTNAQDDDNGDVGGLIAGQNN